MNAHAKLTVDRTTHSIVLVRTIAGSREEVFDAWTKPEQVTEWWDPSGSPLAECSIDLRPGGAFKFLHQGTAYAFSGVYREITPPQRLVFDANGAVGTVSLEAGHDTTWLTVTIVCRSSEHLDQFLKMGVDAGTSSTLDNLVRYIDGKG